MITLKNITLENFAIIESLYVDFTASNFHVIVGDNGSGKSSLLNALALVLFEHKVGDSYKEYVRYECEYARIILNASFKNNPISFNVQINSASNRLPLERKMSYLGKEYVNSEIKTFLQENMDMSIIENIMFSLQKDENNISKLSPSQRRDMFRDLFDISFTEESRMIQSNIETLKQESVKYSTEISILQSKKYDESPLKDVIPQSEADTLSDHLLKLKDVYDEYKTKFFHQAALDKIKTDESKISQYELDTVIKLRDIKKEESVISAWNESLSLDDKTVADKEKQYEGLSKDFAIFTEENTNLRIRIASINDNLTRERDAERDHQEGRCVRCKRSFSDDENHEFQSVIEDINSKLKDVQSRFDACKTRLTQIKSQMNDLSDQIVSARSTKSAKVKSISDSRSKIALLQQTIDMNSKRISELDQDIRSARNKIPKDISVKEVTKAELDKLEQDMRSIELTLSERKVILAQNMVIETNNLKIQNEETDDKIKIQDLTKSVNSTNMLINSNEEALSMLSVDLVNYIIIKNCNTIEEYINEFIDNVKADLKIKLIKTRKGVELFYTPIKAQSLDVNKWSSVKMCSGFEQDLINLSFKVALAKAYNLKVLILDEADSAANDSNSYKLFSLIANITDFDQVIIVTHKDSVKQIIEEEASSVVSYIVSKGVYNVA